MSCGLDDLLTDMMRDNFGTEGEEWMDCDESMINDFSHAEDSFDGGNGFSSVLAQDPILGNMMHMLDKKKDVDIVTVVKTEEPLPVATTPTPSGSTSPCTPPAQQQQPLPLQFAPPSQGVATPASGIFCSPFMRLAAASTATTAVVQEPNNALKRVRLHSGDDKEQMEEDKREKKRQAVRKCREKKRREMKDLEQRAVHFDAEIRELRNQLQLARSAGGEDSTKNMAELESFMEALRAGDADGITAASSKLLSGDCTAISPSSGQELRGFEAVSGHFNGLAAAFRVSQVSHTFVVDANNASIIRCNFSLSLSHVAHAFGIHTHPGAPSSLLSLAGSCKFTFQQGQVSEINISYDHSQFLLQLLGIPSI
jgi:hypothetical protein